MKWVNMSKNEESKQVKNKIEKWLLEENFRVKSDTESNNLFTLLVEEQKGIRSVVIQPLQAIDRIIIAITTEIAKEQQAKINKMDKGERSQFFWEITSGLLNLQVNFTAISIPLKQVRIMVEIYYDGLTKNSFMSSYGRVRRALAFLLLSLERKVGSEGKIIDTSYIG